MSESTTPKISPLTSTNYSTWSQEMKAVLMRLGAWPLVAGKRSKPSPLNPSAPSATEVAAMEKWEDLAFKAAGELFLCVPADQRRI